MPKTEGVLDEKPKALGLSEAVGRTHTVFVSAERFWQFSELLERSEK